MGILKPLGTTSILVSPIALGTVKFGRNQGVKYPAAFDLPQDTDIKNLLSLCQELQINFLDTAAAYGLSEERIGKLLTHRQQWVISTKAGEEFQDGKSYYDFSPKHIRRSVERSLRRLKTDYLDLVLIHSDGNDEKIIHETDSLQTLHQLKEAGYIRALGMSTKTMAGGLQALTLCDAVMLSYNPLYTTHIVLLSLASVVPLILTALNIYIAVRYVTGIDLSDNERNAIAWRSRAQDQLKRLGLPTLLSLLWGVLRGVSAGGLWYLELLVVQDYCHQN